MRDRNGRRGRSESRRRSREKIGKIKNHEDKEVLCMNCQDGHKSTNTTSRSTQGNRCRNKTRERSGSSEETNYRLQISRETSPPQPSRQIVFI